MQTKKVARFMIKIISSGLLQMADGLKPMSSCSQTELKEVALSVPVCCWEQGPFQFHWRCDQQQQKMEKSRWRAEIQTWVKDKELRNCCK